MACCSTVCSSPCGSGCYRGIGSSGFIPIYGMGSGISGGIGGFGGIGGGSGGNLSYVAHNPSAEVYIQPAPAIVSLPGPSLTSSSEPLAIGLGASCNDFGSIGGSSLLSGGLSGGRIGYGGGRGYSRRCISSCGPC